MTLNLTALGKLYGVSCRVVGQWLWEIGLRTGDGRPSQRAFDDGYVSQARLPQGGYYWVWDGPKTIQALEQAGHEMPKKTTARINGPFTMIESAPDTYEIRSGDGTTAIWVMGENNAEFLTRLLNLAYENGRLQPRPE